MNVMSDVRFTVQPDRRLAKSDFISFFGISISHNREEQFASSFSVNGLQNKDYFPDLLVGNDR